MNHRIQISLFTLALILPLSGFSEEAADSLEEAVGHFETALDTALKMDTDVIQKVKDYQEDVQALRAQTEKVKKLEIEVEELQSELNMNTNQMPLNPQNGGQGGGSPGGGSGGGGSGDGSGGGAPQIPEFSSATMPDPIQPTSIDSGDLTSGLNNSSSDPVDFTNNLGSYTPPAFSKNQQTPPQQFAPAQVAANGMPKMENLPAMQTPSNGSSAKPQGGAAPASNPGFGGGGGGMNPGAGANAGGDPFSSVGRDDGGSAPSGIAQRLTEYSGGGEGGESTSTGGLSYGSEKEITRSGAGSLGAAKNQMIKLSRYLLAQIGDAPEGNIFQKATLSIYDYCGFLGDTKKEVDRPDLCVQALLNEEAVASSDDTAEEPSTEKTATPHKAIKKSSKLPPGVREIASTPAETAPAPEEEAPKVPRAKGISKSKKSIPDDLLEAVRAGVL